MPTPSVVAVVVGVIVLTTGTLLASFLAVLSRPSRSGGAWNRDGLRSAGLILGCTVVAVLAFWWIAP